MAEETKNKENDDLIVEDLYKEESSAQPDGTTPKPDAASYPADQAGYEQKEKSPEPGREITPEKVLAGNSSRKEKRKGSSLAVRVLVAVLCTAAFSVLAAGIFWYASTAKQFKTVFFPNTTVNGMDISLKTPEEAKQMINAGLKGYTLTVKARDMQDATITSADVGLEYVFGDTFEKIISAQEPYRWALHLQKYSDFKIDTLAKIDDRKFADAVGRLSCMDKTKFVQPVDAKISDYQQGSGYTVIKETNGNVLDTEKAAALIRKSILESAASADLQTPGENFYAEPKVKADDAHLNAVCDSLNHYVLTEIDYKDGNGMVLNGTKTKDWITLEQDMSVSVNQDKVTAFVKELAAKYDTYNKAKQLRTSWGTDVTVKGGSYGWKMNQDAEIAFINATLPTGQKVQREPEFSKKAASHGLNDYGNTYVEINLTAQHLYYYKDGSAIVSTDFVSGCTSLGRGTPTGIYQIAYKQRNAILKGQGYASPVDFWMPFNGGVGLHDASWRSTFGGKIYVTGGSHGCINLPRSAAETIYNNISAGCPVLVYNQDGSVTGPITEEAKADQADAGTTPPAAEATKPAEQTAAASSAAAETKPAETTAAAVKPAETVKAAEAQTEAATEAVTGVNGGPGVKKSADPAASSVQKKNGPGV